MPTTADGTQLDRKIFNLEVWLIEIAELDFLNVGESDALILRHLVDVVVVPRHVVRVAWEDQDHIHVFLGGVTWKVDLSVWLQVVSKTIAMTFGQWSSRHATSTWSHKSKNPKAQNESLSPKIEPKLLNLETDLKKMGRGLSS